MRIGWFSNSPWAGTGYGVQTAEVLPRLKAAGHEVASISNYGLAGAPLDWQGIPCLPMGYDAWSNDIGGAHVANWVNGKGWGVVLYDVWTINGPMWDNTPLAAWVPVDHDPAPAQVAGWFKKPNTKRVAIAMSRFGEDRLKNAGVQDVLYVPHTVNTELFKPEGDNYRSKFGIPDDAFVVIVNAANKGIPPRKSWPEIFAAFSIFASKHKDAYLYAHTEPYGLAGGVNLFRLREATKAPIDRVIFAPQYQYRTGIPTEEMPGIYRMGDVFLSPSRGEGFGVGSIEAQAVGLPVIQSKWTAQKELVGAGWLIGGQPEWNEGMASWFLAPSIDQIVQALEASYEAKQTGARAELAAEARKFALQYDTDVVFEKHWKPVLADLQDRLAPPLNRQQRRAQDKAKLKAKSK